MIADVDRDGLASTEAGLRDQGIDAHGRFCDVSKADSVDALAATAFDELGGAALVFANAGIGAGGTIENVNLFEYDSW